MFHRAAVALALLLGACTAAPSALPPTGSEAEAPAAAADADAPFDPGSLQLRLVPVVAGLDSPLGVTHAGDGTNRLYIIEQGGLIRIVRDGSLKRLPFLDISSLTTGGGERGLLGLAFHPDYESNRRFFINYTDTQGNTVIAEYLRSADRPGRADATSARVLLAYDQPFANHNGGALVFGPDGYLYIASGDGGGAGDPMGNGQRLDTLLGKILRIDVDSGSGDVPYGIPDDNPFAGDPSAREEIWDFGLRNPWRITFDRRTGALWIGDVGQDNFEEIDREPADDPGGVNYGWNLMEGDRCYPSGLPNCPARLAGDLREPIAVYSHDLGCSVTGGYVYRGARYPAMRGGYLFADFCSGNMWAIAAAGPSPQDPVLVLESGRPISSFGEGPNGNLYVTDYGGELLKVVGSAG